MIVSAIRGKTKHEIFESLHECPNTINITHPDIVALTRPDAKWRTRDDREIITLPGRALWTLEAALWCVAHTDTFRDAIVTAVNLGGDADTVGSVTGQIAGAIYGFDTFPPEWVRDLHHADQIVARAKALYGHLPYDAETMALRRDAKP